MSIVFWDKLVKDKEGHTAIIQRPNLQLIGALVLMCVYKFLPNGTIKVITFFLAFTLLYIWAIGEIWKGRSLFRRLLGIVVLVCSLMAQFRLLR
jgi:hypothetical protein